jgi:ribonuclease HI
MNKPARLTAHSDGAARGNPGPAGVGVVIKDADGRPLARIARYLGIRTNNQAEYEGVVLALETAAGYQPAHLDLFMDSELIVRQLQGAYRVRRPQLLPLYERSRALLRRFPSVVLHHVPRAANRQADALANKAIDEAIKQTS